MVLGMSMLMAYTHQPHITVARDSGYTVMTDVSSFQLRDCGAGLYSFNVEPADDLDAYLVHKNETIFVRPGDVLYIKGDEASINVAWTKEY